MSDTEAETGTWAGATLRALRLRKKLTQEALGEAAGLDRTTVIHLEKGRRKMTPHYAAALAVPLKVKAHELLPPEADATDPQDPFARLRELEVTAARDVLDLRRDLAQAIERIRVLETRSHGESQQETEAQ